MQVETEEAKQATAVRPPVTIVAHDVGGVGGMERVLAELALGLRERGHEVIVIARTCTLATTEGIVFRRVRAPARPLLLGLPWFLVAGSFAVRRWRRGVVQSTGAIVLNHVDVVAVHYCHQVGPASPSRATLLFRLHSKAMGVLNRLAERVCFAINAESMFVCVSEGVAGEVREHYPGVADRVLTIYNGVDIESFAPGLRTDDASALRTSLKIGPDRLIAAFVGGEWERKGLEPVIRALASAPDWDLVIAGAGDRQGYQELADSLGVGQVVHWLGVISDVQPIYGLADAFVLASRYETFSLVTFEAAASGLAILATPVSGVRDLIEDGRNGFLVSREPTQIAERLNQLADDPLLRARLGRAARQSAREFSWQRMVDDHEQLYAQLPAPEQRIA